MKKMKKKSMWSLNLNTATLVLIPTAVAINYIGKYFASLLKLPLWLDSIGTILAGFIGGPIAGAAVGVLNNIIYGFQDPIVFVYALTSAAIGVVAGVCAHRAEKKTVKWAIMTAILIALTAIVISTPLNIYFWEGQTGNAIGDAAFAWAITKGYPLWLASLIDEVIIDLPDKIITVFIVYGIFKVIPKKLLLLYSDKETVESLD